ncbi:unnamed protein product, partial [Iphiclides podalirius]
MTAETLSDKDTHRHEDIITAVQSQAVTSPLNIHYNFRHSWPRRAIAFITVALTEVDDRYIAVCGSAASLISVVVRTCRIRSRIGSRGDDVFAFEEPGVQTNTTDTGTRKVFIFTAQNGADNAPKRGHCA